MVVCKFFQQGYCRFGKNCRYEHIYGSKYTYHANPSTQPVQQAPAPTQPVVGAGVTDEQLVNQVQSDIQAALGGGQWILSCYAPYKEKPLFPGIMDLSPEEARLFIYEAKNNNTIGEAITFMNNLFKDSRLKYEQLLQPNINIIKVLRSLYKGEMVASPFSNAPQSNVQQTGFSNSNNAASSIFRSAVQTAPLSPNANNAQSIFSQGQKSMFSSQAADPAKQLFSQATNVFGPSQPPENIFAQNQNTDPKSIFATAAKSNFTTPNHSSPQNIFATANQSFQTVQNPSSFAQAKPDAEDDGVYSKIEDLPDADLEAFGADSFQLGFIPELPPPRELCTHLTRTSYFH